MQIARELHEPATASISAAITALTTARTTEPTTARTTAPAEPRQQSKGRRYTQVYVKSDSRLLGNLLVIMSMFENSFGSSEFKNKKNKKARSATGRQRPMRPIRENDKRKWITHSIRQSKYAL